jgi:hypothetical protein
MPQFKPLVLLCSRVFGVTGYGALVGPTWLAPLAVAVISCTLNPTVREFSQISGGCLAGIAISVALQGPFAYAVGLGLVGAALVGLTASALIEIPTAEPSSPVDVICTDWHPDTTPSPPFQKTPSQMTSVVKRTATVISTRTTESSPCEELFY